MTQQTQGTLPDIRHTYVLNAPAHKVWRAIATSQGLEAWLMPNDFQPVMGQEFVFRTEPVGDFDGIVRCKVMELDPPHRLGFSWAGNGMEQYVSFELKERDQQTEFTLVHSGWLEGQEMVRAMLDEGWGKKMHIEEHIQKAIEQFA
jgi:uncharacterized protein YndB with AHSA1/START domain